jgi:hypothetical protein
MYGDERKYRFSLIRGIVKFIPYQILMLFMAHMSSMSLRAGMTRLSLG